MNINSLPRCITGKLPGLHRFSHLPVFPPQTNPTTMNYNSIHPSPNGAFKPINSSKSSTAECPVPSTRPAQSLPMQAKCDTDITSTEPATAKRKLNACDEEEDKVRIVEERKARRAEKNRKFAKESRDRKRKHVQDLENEVKYLREQLENYKQRLKKYELIEKHSNGLGKEVYNTLINIYQEMNRLNLPLTNHSAFVEGLKKKVTETFEEQKCALMQLTRAMVDIALPLPLRMAIWLNENQVDLLDYEKRLENLGAEPPANHIKILVNCIKELCPEKAKYYEMQSDLADIGKRIKSFMKQVIKLQNEIQKELVSYEKYIDTKLVPDGHAQILKVLVSLSPYFNSIIEVCQISGINS